MSTTGIIHVSVPNAPYTIRFGRGELANLGLALREIDRHGRVMLITNSVVGALYAPQAEHALRQAGLEPSTVTIPDGEQYKSLETMSFLYKNCLDCELDRSSTIVALGGGVVGDIAGFVAATYMRGIAFVQVPTSLLAQVDASIGGKVAVDFGGRKNIVGAFHQPRMVLTDTDLLATLPPEQFRGGMAEIIKAAVLGDADLFEYLEDHGADPLDEIVKRAILVKVRVVEQDPHEHGLRMVLNLGHTIGHGIEAASGYQLSHGDSVSLGMVAAADIAVDLKLCEITTRDRLVDLLRRFDLPVSLNNELKNSLSDDGFAAVMNAMRADKKRHSGLWRFVLPRAIGIVDITDNVHDNLIILALEQLCGGN